VARITHTSRCRAIMWGATVTSADVLAAVAAGAAGILTKEMSEEGLLRALAAACRGEAVLGRWGATWMVDAVRRAALEPTGRTSLDRLSTREREVLRLVALRCQNREIGEALGVSEFTVKRHVQNILGKLGHSSRDQAAATYLTGIAHRAALSAPPPSMCVGGDLQGGF
jgi:DNA-binding NarL/FixJ family response regulator